MRGHISKQKNGRYRAQVYLGPKPGGGKKYRNKTFDRKHDAEDWVAEQIRQRDGGIRADAPNITLGQWLRQWMTDYVEGRLAGYTRDGYARIVRKIEPRLGHLRLQRLTAQHIQEYYKDAGKTLSAQTVLHHHRLLHKALKDAVRAGYLGVNPVEGTIAPRPGCYRSGIPGAFHAQERRILRFCCFTPIGVRPGGVEALPASTSPALPCE